MAGITYGTISLAELGISQEEIEREMAIYCDCENPDENPQYVNKINIKGVGMVNHHGWVCRCCGKYVQVG